MPRVPLSLGKYPATATPLYLSLTAAETKAMKTWRNITPGMVYSNSSETYILPPPKIGMGLGTHSESMDEVEFWQTSSVGDKARMILGDVIFYGVSKVIGDFVDGAQNYANYQYMFGKSTLPRDLSALQYKGMRKRAYNFSFELFAYKNDDFEAIVDFTKSMHSFCMPKGDYNNTMYTPAVFMFNILQGGGDGNIGNDVTNNWFFSPKPCTMIGFNSSAVDYMAINGSYSSPARVAVNMLLAEIEPVVLVDGAVKSIFEIATNPP